MIPCLTLYLLYLYIYYIYYCPFARLALYLLYLMLSCLIIGLRAYLHDIRGTLYVQIVLLLYSNEKYRPLSVICNIHSSSLALGI
jgi:hypothetical protein